MFETRVFSLVFLALWLVNYMMAVSTEESNFSFIQYAIISTGLLIILIYLVIRKFQYIRYSFLGVISFTLIVIGDIIITVSMFQDSKKVILIVLTLFFMILLNISCFFEVQD